MANHGNRGRVSILPLNSNYRRWHYRVLCSSLPVGWVPEGLCRDGLLARSPVGTLAVWQSDRMVSIDRRKAEAAIAAQATKL